MKNKFKFIFLMIFIVLTFVTISSCKNNDYQIDRNLSEIFKPTGGTFSTYYSKKTKLTIKTGKSNYAGHFRLTYDGEEILNSKDYNYLVPKGLTIFSKIIDPYSNKTISFEILDRNSFMDIKYNKEENHKCYAKINKESIKKLIPATYKRTATCDFNLNFNDLSNHVNKGLTYMLFTHDEFALAAFGPGYVESYNDNLLFEISCQKKDYNKKTYGYMIIKSKIDNYNLLKSDFKIKSNGEHFDIFIRDDSSFMNEFSITTLSRYVELCFINIEEIDKRIIVNYSYSCHDIDQLKYGKFIKGSNVDENIDNDILQLDLTGTGENNYSPITGEPYGIYNHIIYNGDVFDSYIGNIKEYTYKIKIAEINI